MGKSLPPRKRKEIIEFVPRPGGETVSAFCRRLGISRKSFYRIRERAQTDAATALVPTSRAPREPVRRYGPQTDEAIARVRAELAGQGYEAGPLSVWWRLQREGHTRLPSPSTIARSLRRQGLVEPNPRKRPKSSYTRFQRARANELWQLDGIRHEVNSLACTIYQIIDDHSRLNVALIAVPGGESAAGAKTALEWAIRRYGAPAIVLTDNSTAFNTHRRGQLSQTERWLADQGIRPISGRPARPTTQGKIERSHQPVEKRLAAIPAATTISELNAQLEAFRDYYNNERQHQGHGLGITPAQVWSYATKATALDRPIPYIDLLAFPAPIPGQDKHDDREKSAERSVGKDGHIRWANRRFYVGIRNHGRTVRILHQATRVLLFNDEGLCFGDIPWPQPGNGATHINVTKPPYFISEPPPAHSTGM
jgi:transposase InsO family protein